MKYLQRLLYLAVVLVTFFAITPPAEAGAPPIWVDARYGISNPSANNGVAAFQDTLNGQPAFGQVTGTGIFDLGSTDDQVLGQVENGGTSNSAFVAWGTDFQSTGMYQIFISRVTAGAEDWNVDITGASFFYGNSAVIKMIPDGSGGVFVLASDGTVGPFGETSGGPTLVYIDSTGNIDFTDGPYGYNNADMVPAGAGAVMVVSNLGYNADDLVQAYEHGIVRRYDTSGLDATFAGGAGFVDLSSSLTEKSDLFAISDGDEGLIAFWSSNDGTPGIYAQHIDFEGVQDGNWDPDGELLVSGTNLTVLSAYEDGFGLYYMAYADATNDQIRVFAFDDFSDSYWACTPLVTNQSDVTNGNEVGILPDNDGLYVFWQGDSSGDQGLYGQFYDYDGHTLGTLGGELIDDADANGGSNFDVVFQDDFSGSVSPATPRVSALKRTVSDHAQVYVSYFDGANDIVERIIVTSASFSGGPGDDCTSGPTPINVGGTDYYVVTSLDPTEDTGDEVCEKVGRICQGFTNFTTDVCTAVNPTATVITNNISGDKSGVYCDGPPQTAVCNGLFNTCTVCPICSSGVTCSEPIGGLYREMYVECGTLLSVLPEAISDLDATAGNGEVVLTWSAPADNGSAITDYVVEYGATSGFPGNAQVFTDGVSTSTGATVTGLTNGVGYSFRVAAVSGEGQGPYSNIETATPTSGSGPTNTSESEINIDVNDFLSFSISNIAAGDEPAGNQPFGAGGEITNLIPTGTNAYAISGSFGSPVFTQLQTTTNSVDGYNVIAYAINLDGRTNTLVRQGGGAGVEENEVIDSLPRVQGSQGAGSSLNSATATGISFRLTDANTSSILRESDEDTQWGDDDAGSALWYSFPLGVGSAQVIYDTLTYSAAATTAYINWFVGISSSQQSGSYSGQITFTASVN
ncbi:MAG: fibronectin type III domain-containing protein [Candidatus Altimarinota bacterium]